jgi:hypothetical protein
MYNPHGQFPSPGQLPILHHQAPFGAGGPSSPMIPQLAAAYAANAAAFPNGPPFAPPLPPGSMHGQRGPIPTHQPSQYLVYNLPPHPSSIGIPSDEGALSPGSGSGGNMGSPNSGGYVISRPYAPQVPPASAPPHMVAHSSVPPQPTSMAMGGIQTTIMPDGSLVNVPGIINPYVGQIVYSQPAPVNAGVSAGEIQTWFNQCK